MNRSFPNRWSFSYLKFTKYVPNIIAKPKYKYGQQEQVKERNHNRSTPISIGWYIHLLIHSVLSPVNSCRGTTDNFRILCSEGDQLESDQLDLLWHVATYCFLQVFEIRVIRIHVVVIKVRHKYDKPFDNLI